MEFDNERNKVVGIVKLHSGKEGENARIKIIGYFENGKGFKKISDSEAIKHFPNEGFVFEPSFFKNKSFKQIVDGDLIEFYATQINERKGSDYFRILDFNAKKIKSEEKIFELQNVKLKIHEIDLTKAEIVDKEYSGDFYGIFEEYVIGKLRIHNGRIIPVMSKEVKKWPKSACEIIKFESNHWLLKKPTDGYILLDAMDKSQLFEWFREKLQIINKSVVKELDEKTKWRSLLPEILGNSTDEVTKLNGIRLKRIESNLDNFNFLVEDIKQFTQISEKLNQTFNSAIERHKKELKLGYAKEIEEFEKNKEIAKQKLELQLSKISIEIAHKNKELSNIYEEIDSSNSKIEIINSNKERILSDFSIIQEVLGNRISTVRVEEQIQEESFVIETVSPNQNTIPITQRDNFSTRLKHFLNQQNINSSFAGKLIPICASCRGAFVKKIELGLAIIEATGNSKFIIQQVEPDWLHFKDLWRNGLEAIWKSSHKNPDILHFLILQDINLSSPECYMRPLLDCMNGIRKHIPFAKTAYPNNLRILATKISSDEPKIGLPLYKQTFNNWGAVGYTSDLEKPDVQFNSIVEGYLEVESFISFKSDEPIEVYATKFTDEYKVLFDNQ